MSGHRFQGRDEALSVGRAKVMIVVPDRQSLAPQRRGHHRSAIGHGLDDLQPGARALEDRHNDRVSTLVPRMNRRHAAVVVDPRCMVGTSRRRSDDIKYRRNRLAQAGKHLPHEPCEPALVGLVARRAHEQQTQRLIRAPASERQPIDRISAVRADRNATSTTSPHRRRVNLRHSETQRHKPPNALFLALDLAPFDRRESPPHAALDLRRAPRDPVLDVVRCERADGPWDWTG